MNMYITKRNAGKTEHLVTLSRKLGYPIIVPTNASKQYILNMAGDLKIKIPEPITIDEVLSNKTAIGYKKFLIDEIDLVLKRIGINCECATLTIE